MHKQSTVDTRILIVEDDPLIIHSALPVLRERGDTMIATSGEQALELIAERPNLVLLDLNLPDMHGLELIKRLRHQLRSHDIPLMVMTATQDNDMEVRCLEAGASDFLRKPLSIPVLDARVKVHLEVQQKTQLLVNLASLDPLTGLANRRTFDAVFDRYWSLHYRQNSPLSLIFTDLDHFKKINDNYGHDGGDQCLVHMAQVLTSIAKRPSDLVCRYGGEEFLVLYPNTDEKTALTLVQKGMAMLQQSPVQYNDERIAMTASWGLACAIPEQSDSSQELIQRADRLLYRAKAEGRNRVISEGVEP
ncbi:GGDEF domain-containing protein [Saccharospirillum mangrovi]|uniref:GGDEF domain-containing protein n=1 Tax=Saccharospirillum mangrovi TaxID=2161747 RepID=UPI000D3BF1BA|nr:diguanylate cyclase [Saccharospirillum mangrovi]